MPQHDGERSRGTPALPENIVSMMEVAGRFEFDPQEATIDAGWVWHHLKRPLLEMARADPEAFLTSLAAAVVPVGGWAVFGAARTLYDVSNIDLALKHPAGREILTASLQFLRDHGVPNNRLTGYEWRFWVDNKGAVEQWLPVRPAPSLDQAPITEFEPGEVRRVAQLTEDFNSNVLYVRCDESGEYAAVVDRKWSEEEPRRARNDWIMSDAIDVLYRKIAEALQVPPYWVDPELEAYFPYPRPDL